jgi:recyclin-1
MEKFETLQPTRLYAPDVKTGKLPKATTAPAQFVGRLPIDLHILVLIHLPIPDFPAYARCSRSLSNLSRHEKVWEVKWDALWFAKYSHFQPLLDQLEDAKKIKDGGLMKNMPPTLAVGMQTTTSVILPKLRSLPQPDSWRLGWTRVRCMTLSRR